MYGRYLYMGNFLKGSARGVSHQIIRTHNRTLPDDQSWYENLLDENCLHENDFVNFQCKKENPNWGDQNYKINTGKKYLHSMQGKVIK